MRIAARANALGMFLAVAVLTATAVAAAGRWHNLARVTVTVQNPSLPPPSGGAHTYPFTTPAKVARATSALNANHIAKRAAVRNMGCTGGYNVTIAIVQPASKRVTLSAYECGGLNFGDVAGNVPGFLKALGIGAP